MDETIVGRDLYYGTTNSKGKTTIHQARVWDADRFLAARREEGAKANKPEERFTVSIHSASEYREANPGRS